jgi:hypothetical protein
VISPAFQQIFINAGEENGIDAQLLFDQYLMCVTGQPFDDYTTADVAACQRTAMKQGFLAKADVEMMHTF